jgi:hypothetical protein
LLDAKVRRGEHRLRPADVGSPFEEAEGSPDGSCGTAVAASMVAPRAISGVNTARGERPVKVAIGRLEEPDRLSRPGDVGDDGGKLGFGLAQVVFADDAAVESILLQLNSVGTRLARVLEHDQKRVGRSQPEVRARDLGRNRDAHASRGNTARRRDRSRRRARRCDTCPRCRARTTFRADAVVVRDGDGNPAAAAVLCDCRERERRRAVDAGREIRLREQHVRPGGLDPRQRAARSRLLANASSISAVSTGSSNAVHQRSSSAFCAAVAVACRQVELRRLGLSHRAAEREQRWRSDATRRGSPSRRSGEVRIVCRDAEGDSGSGDPWSAACSAVRCGPISAWSSSLAARLG